MIGWISRGSETEMICHVVMAQFSYTSVWCFISYHLKLKHRFVAGSNLSCVVSIESRGSGVLGRRGWAGR